MSSLCLPPTIEEDDEVPVDDSDSEQELPVREKGRKSAGKKQQTSIFSEDFSFPVETGVSGGSGAVEGGWSVEEEVLEWAEKKRDLVVTSLDSKILRAMERRKPKVLEVYTHYLVSWVDCVYIHTG